MTQETVVSNIGNVEATNFTLEANASVFQMLTKNVYNDIILAPMREWSTNAVDACIEAGIKPIFEVHIPTLEESHFSVRDYGTGLSQEDILGLFSTFGASTKRGSNKFNGTFGIGRMSGLAYTTSFTIESYYNGTKHTYLISLKAGIPVSVHLGSTTTDELNGLKLSLDVNPIDIHTFIKKAKYLYKHFEYKPLINIEIPELNVTLEHEDFILTTEYNNGIVMGNVYYELSYQHVHSNIDGIILKVPIGSVSITPGRESLTYDTTTIDYITKQIKAAEAIIITEADKTIVAKSTILEQFETYEELYAILPYKVRSKLKLPTLPSGTAMYNTNYNSLFNITHPNFYVMVKVPNHKLNRHMSNTSISIKDFIDYPKLLVDKRNYSSVLPEIDNDYIVIFRPKELKKENFVNDVPIIEKFLEQLNITDYHKVSDFDLSAKKTKKEKVTTISLKQTSSGNYFYPGFDYDPNKNTEEILYIELNKNTPTIGVDAVQALIALHKDLITLGYKIPRIYGVPKTYIKSAENTDTFTEAFEYIKSYLNSNKITITIDSKDFGSNYHYMTHRLKDTLRHSKYTPTDLKEAIIERETSKSSNSIRSTQDTINTLKPLLPINTKTITFKYDFNELTKKYKYLLALDRLDVSIINYYLELEYNYENNISKNE